MHYSLWTSAATDRWIAYGRAGRPQAIHSCPQYGKGTTGVFALLFLWRCFLLGGLKCLFDGLKHVVAFLVDCHVLSQESVGKRNK